MSNHYNQNSHSNCRRCVDSILSCDGGCRHDRCDDCRDRHDDRCDSCRDRRDDRRDRYDDRRDRRDDRRDRYDNWPWG